MNAACIYITLDFIRVSESEILYLIIVPTKFTLSVDLPLLNLLNQIAVFVLSSFVCYS
jgi:hypothetical protein